MGHILETPNGFYFNHEIEKVPWGIRSARSGKKHDKRIGKVLVSTIEHM